MAHFHLKGCEDKGQQVKQGAVVVRRRWETLTVTDNAKQHLKELLLAYARASELGVRLALGASGQFGVLLDQEKTGDYVVKHEGLKVLLVEPELMSLVAGATLDTENAAHGPRLVICKERGGKHYEG